MNRKKRIAVCLSIGLCLVLVILAAQTLKNHFNRIRILKAVGLENMSGLKQVDYVYWQDLLKYADGYEIMVFAVDGASWVRPESWINEADQVSVDQVIRRIGIGVNTGAILNLSLGGESCDAWFFADHRMNRPFDKQDFYFAYCDETYNSRAVIFVYRGHHLYSV